jgi:hypothetical protein
MLSKFFLIFAEKQMRDRYNHEKKDFYKKATPIIATLSLALSVTLEVLPRLSSDYGELSMQTSIINWACFAIFLTLSFLVRRWIWTSWFICPILTLLMYYYFAFYDF